MFSLQSGSTTLEKNIKLLNVSTKGNLYEMESHMSVHLDRAREDGLMLWQLLTRSIKISCFYAMCAHCLLHAVRKASENCTVHLLMNLITVTKCQLTLV